MNDCKNDLETLGFYEPGFFHMRINIDDDLTDLNEFASNPTTRRYFSTFIHEYIHFLQEVTSSSGLLACLSHVELLRDLISEILNEARPTFKVPRILTNVHNTEVNSKLRRLYAGEKEGAALVRYDSYTEERESFNDNEGNQISATKYRVFFYELHSGVRRSIYFGHTCLKEFVAHSVQKMLIPSIEHGDIPYVIAEQVAIKECPTLRGNTKLIIALCDASLMAYHPAQFFFNSLKRLAGRNLPATAEEMYDYLYNEVIFQYKGRQESVNSLFEATSKMAEQVLADALKSDIFRPNYIWVSHILKEARELRLENPAFITQLVTEDHEVSTTCYEIFQRLGTPFFTNRKHAGRFIPPRGIAHLAIQPFQLRVFMEVIRTLFGEKGGCSMHTFCKTRIDKDMTSADCLSSPWKKVNEFELCPFAQIWKTWGLNQKEPVRSN